MRWRMVATRCGYALSRTSSTHFVRSKHMRWRLMASSLVISLHGTSSLTLSEMLLITVAFQGSEASRGGGRGRLFAVKEAPLKPSTAAVRPASTPYLQSRRPYYVYVSRSITMLSLRTLIHPLPSPYVVCYLCPSSLENAQFRENSVNIR